MHQMTLDLLLGLYSTSLFIIWCLHHCLIVYVCLYRKLSLPCHQMEPSACAKQKFMESMCRKCMPVSDSFVELTEHYDQFTLLAFAELAFSWQYRQYLSICSVCLFYWYLTHDSGTFQIYDLEPALWVKPEEKTRPRLDSSKVVTRVNLCWNVTLVLSPWLSEGLSNERKC